MSGPIRTDRQTLIHMANQECGYKSVWVEPGDTGRWSHSGNLVVEHNTQGTQDVCRDGRVVAHQALDRGGVPANPIPLPPGGGNWHPDPGPAFPPPGNWDPRPDYPHHGGFQGSFDERLAQLNRIYQNTSMTSSEKNVLERQIIADEMGRLLNDRYSSVDSRLQQLNHVYQATSMTSTEKNAYERQIIADAVNRLIADRYAPVESRLAQLNHLYQTTSMTSSEKAAYERQIIGQAVGYRSY